MFNVIVNRITRIVFGSALIATTMLVNVAPLGGFALLALIASPLILSGIYGENPLGELVNKPVTKIKERLETTIAKVFKHPTITT